MLVHPSHPLAAEPRGHAGGVRAQTVIAHNDPSHVRDRVLRLFEQHHIPANILVSLPSLEGIKRAVAMRLGVALLPRRCAESEIARGELVALHDAGDPAAPAGAPRLPQGRRAIARLGGVPRGSRGARDERPPAV
jgi:DNA-binding transcriptional LysR family regulator